MGRIGTRGTRSTPYTAAGARAVRGLNKRAGVASPAKFRAMNSKTKRGPGGSFKK